MCNELQRVQAQPVGAWGVMGVYGMNLGYCRDTVYVVLRGFLVIGIRMQCHDCL